MTAAPFYVFTNSSQVFPLLCILANACYLLLFWRMPFWHPLATRMETWLTWRRTRGSLRSSSCLGSDAKAETPVLWPPDVKSWLIGKTLMLGRIQGGKKRGRQWMRWLDGITDSAHEIEQNSEGNEGQGSLLCCSSWDHKESDMTERLNWAELINIQNI